MLFFCCKISKIQVSYFFPRYIYNFPNSLCFHLNVLTIFPPGLGGCSKSLHVLRVSF